VEEIMVSRNILGIFDGADIGEISALIDKLEKSSFDYMKLQGDGISIVIGKNGSGEVSAAAAAIAPPAAEIQAPAPVLAGPPVEDAAPEAAIPSEKQAVAEQEGIFIVKSPNYGMFYAQSQPGAPPYVNIGDSVKSGDTIGLLETMKTFTAIISPTDGEVAAIHVKNQEALELDQPLMSIKVSK